MHKRPQFTPIRDGSKLSFCTQIRLTRIIIFSPAVYNIHTLYDSNIFSLHYFSDLRAVCLFFLMKWSFFQKCCNSWKFSWKQFTDFKNILHLLTTFFSLYHTELRYSEGPTNEVYPGCFYCRLSWVLIEGPWLCGILCHGVTRGND